MNPIVISKVENKIGQRKLYAEAEYKFKSEALRAEHPAYAALDAELRALVSDIDMDRSLRKELIEKKKTQISEYLEENGLTLPSLRYTCSICGDTGYVDGKRCSCFNSLLVDELTKDGDIISKSTFESFDLDIFAPEIRKTISDVKDFAYTFSQKFPDVNSPHILFFGETGTGKTFMLSCIYNELRARGKNVIFITAGKLFDILRKYAFNEENSLDMLMDCDALFIDDLGTEPVFNNITVEYLFMLINERYRTNKSFLISTNLSPDQIKKRYSERISSRLFSRKYSKLIKLPGEDLHMR